MKKPVFGGGAMKAIEKSVGQEGDEGVTMMAGKSDFSSAKGRERSIPALSALYGYMYADKPYQGERESACSRDAAVSG